MSDTSSTPSFQTLEMPVCPGPTASMYRSSWYRYTMGPRGDPRKTPTQNCQALVVLAAVTETI